MGFAISRAENELEESRKLKIVKCCYKMPRKLWRKREREAR